MSKMESFKKNLEIQAVHLPRFFAANGPTEPTGVRTGEFLRRFHDIKFNGTPGEKLSHHDFLVTTESYSLLEIAYCQNPAGRMTEIYNSFKRAIEEKVGEFSIKSESLQSDCQNREELYGKTAVFFDGDMFLLACSLSIRFY